MLVATLWQKFNAMFFGPKTDLTAEQFVQKLQAEGGVVIDCRTRGEAAEGTWPGAKVIDWMGGEMEGQIAALDPTQNHYLYCRSGARSGAATQFLRSHGFAKAFNLGGFGSIAHLA